MIGSTVVVAVSAAWPLGFPVIASGLIVIVGSPSSFFLFSFSHGPLACFIGAELRPAAPGEPTTMAHTVRQCPTPASLNLSQDREAVL